MLDSKLCKKFQKIVNSENEKKLQTFLKKSTKKINELFQYTILKQLPSKIPILLLLYGADPNLHIAISSSEYTALNQLQPLKVTKVLFQQRIDQTKMSNDNYFNIPVLNFCCKHYFESLELIEKLLAMKANPNSTDGFTPLHFVCKNEKGAEVVKILLKYGANPNLPDKKVPLHLVCETVLNQEIIENLLNSGANPNLQDLKTPLHILCENQPQASLIQLLLQHGADPNIKDDSIPLHLVCEGDNIEVIKLLLEKGANPNIQNNVLFIFSINKVFIYLFIKNFESNFNLFRTPFHYACLRKSPRQIEKIKLLLDSGSLIDIQDTPIGLASREIQQYIRSYQSIIEDMVKLSKQEVSGDVFLEGKEFQVVFHKCILENRIGSEKIWQFIKGLSSKKKEEVELVKEYVYSGSSRALNAQKLLEKLGIFLKPGRPQLLADLSKLQLQNETKDFGIKVDQKEVRVHRVILIARSDLYQNMFINVVDDSNCVTDYSGRSFDTVQKLINFFYTDEMDINSISLKEELRDACDYYQLNENSMLMYLLEKK
ncbi:pote ankyrin domain [Anaeramoeba ignava]|uniref:Pote ankyrin domain n=1 Tax=Anaeramoeba ignava TaxID=1746090 RepID=A0A9Q0RI38_ANAIG|nr:pote ankyrin domain [Anaeramoeba ignava]